MRLKALGVVVVTVSAVSLGALITGRISTEVLWAVALPTGGVGLVAWIIFNILHPVVAEPDVVPDWVTSVTASPTAEHYRLPRLQRGTWHHWVLDGHILHDPNGVPHDLHRATGTRLIQSTTLDKGTPGGPLPFRLRVKLADQKLNIVAATPHGTDSHEQWDRLQRHVVVIISHHRPDVRHTRRSSIQIFAWSMLIVAALIALLMLFDPGTT